MSRYTPPKRTATPTSSRDRRAPQFRLPAALTEMQDRPGWPTAVIVALVESWAATDKYFSTPSACIAATRAGIDILQSFGVVGHPWPCEVAVFNEAARKYMDAGTPIEEWDPAAWSVGVHPDLYTGGKSAFGGHLVIESSDLIVDLAAAQFDRPDRGLHAGPMLLPLPQSDGKGGPVYLKDGTCFRYRHRPDLASWRQGPDWRRGPLSEMTSEVSEAVAEWLLAGLSEPEDQ